MNYLAFLFSHVISNLRSSWAMQLMTMVAVTISVLIFSFFCLISTNIQQIGLTLEEEVKIIAYLNQDQTPVNILRLTNKITKISDASAINHITPEQALSKMARQLGPEKALLNGLSPSFLPHTLEITPGGPGGEITNIKDTAGQIAALPGVVKVQYGEKWLKRFNQITHLIKATVILSGILLILTTTFMVSYTIHLSLNSRSDELQILKLLGATDSYIKGPVVMEAFLLGTGSALTGLAFLYLLFQWLINSFNNSNALYFIHLSFLPLPITVIILSLCIIFCVSGSLISIRKILHI